MDYDLQLVEAGVVSGDTVITATVTIYKNAEILQVYLSGKLVQEGSK
jgi:hypothetical protein